MLVKETKRAWQSLDQFHMDQLRRSRVLFFADQFMLLRIYAQASLFPSNIRIVRPGDGALRIYKSLQAKYQETF